MKKIFLLKDKPIRKELFKTVDYALGFVIFFISFGVYLHTLTSTIGFHDSEELIISF